MTVTEKVLDRIRKLLELAKSSNANEAALAAGRAAELMAKHHLVQAELEGPHDIEIVEVVLDRSKSRVGWKQVLASGVCDGFGCRGYSARKGSWRDGVRRTEAVDSMIIGRSADVATARYMYAYLVREVGRLADAGATIAQPARPRSWKHSFRLGAAHEIAVRLASAREAIFAAARTAGGQAIVLVDAAQAELDDRVAGMGLGAAPRTALSSADGLYAGRRAGREVNLGGNRALGIPALQLEGKR